MMIVSAIKKGERIIISLAIQTIKNRSKGLKKDSTLSIRSMRKIKDSHNLEDFSRNLILSWWQVETQIRKHPLATIMNPENPALEIGLCLRHRYNQTKDLFQDSIMKNRLSRKMAISWTRNALNFNNRNVKIGWKKINSWQSHLSRKRIHWVQIGTFFLVNLIVNKHLIHKMSIKS